MQLTFDEPVSPPPTVSLVSGGSGRRPRQWQIAGNRPLFDADGNPFGRTTLSGATFYEPLATGDAQRQCFARQLYWQRDKAVAADAKLVVCADLAAQVAKDSKCAFKTLHTIKGARLNGAICHHPLKLHPEAKGGYDFEVPLLAGEDMLGFVVLALMTYLAVEAPQGHP